MATTRMRPTFDLEVRLPADETMGLIRERLDEVPRTRRCMSKGRCAELYLSDDERKPWSPYLSIQAEPKPEGANLHGRFSPYPEVWTFFLFMYGTAWFVAVFGAILGYVQWASDEPAWGMWGLWGGLAVVLLLHVASAVGQRLGQDQMETLRRMLDGLLEGLEVREVDPAEPSGP